jgi:plastocyanin
MHLRLALATTAAAALVVPSLAGAALYGRVGPGPSISLKRASGTTVTHLSPGSRTFVIRDRASNHNFHLTGRGVNKRTGVAFVGRRKWRNIQLSSGTYRYICDVHPSTMRGSFSVG